MLLTRRIRIIPTDEQMHLFFKSAGIARWAYNYFLGLSKELYELQGFTLKESDVRKYINNVLKKTTHVWLKAVSANVVKQAVKDASLARERFFKGISQYPKFKSRHKSKPGFYVNYESLKATQNGFIGERLGNIKTSERLPKLAKGKKYSNPRITFDGINWWITVGYDVMPQAKSTSSKSIGVDIGIKELAVCSNGMKFRNINKTKRVKKLTKRLKQQQRRLAKKTIGSLNRQKQKTLINITHKKINHQRNNHLHQATTRLAKTKPKRIVVESLNIKGMMKNRHLSRAIASQKMHEFLFQLKYKCEKFGIEFVAADKWYPSSKMCSDCGSINPNLKLSDRIYNCHCGLSLDRDFNASINLANYQSIA